MLVLIWLFFIFVKDGKKSPFTHTLLATDAWCCSADITCIFEKGTFSEKQQRCRDSEEILVCKDQVQKPLLNL